MAGPRGASTVTRRAHGHLARDLRDVGPLGEAGLDRGLEALHEAGEAVGAVDEAVQDLPALLRGAVPLASVCAMPRITVTGVRSSWPRREISSCRRAARSSRASCAISSWRVRRRSRSRASVSSSITVGVTSGEITPPPMDACRTACRISSPSESFSTYPDAPATSMSRTARWSSEPVRATMPSAGYRRLEPRVVVDPVHARHAHIHQHDVGLGHLDHLERLGPRSPLGPRRSSRRYRAANQRLAEPFVVVDEQHPYLGQGLGRPTLAGAATSLMKEVSARTADDGIRRTPGSFRGTEDPSLVPRRLGRADGPQRCAVVTAVESGPHEGPSRIRVGTSDILPGR